MADAFNVGTLRAQVETFGGFAKGNRYNVTFTKYPAGLTGAAVVANLPYLCESASLPTKSLASTPHDIYGPPREMPYRETFTDAALSFILDDAFTVKKFFDEWQTKIINPITNNPGYYRDYVGTINISRLSNDATSLTEANHMYNIQLIEVYPSAVGEVALGHTLGADVLRLAVTFKYRRWNFLPSST